MQYKVYQIQLTDAEIDLINEKGHNAVHKQSLKLDMNFKDNTGSIAADAFKRGYYTHVANITDDTLEGVFHIGNMVLKKILNVCHVCIVSVLVILLKLLMVSNLLLLRLDSKKWLDNVTFLMYSDMVIKKE